MKFYILLSLSVTFISNAYSAECSYGILDNFKKEVQATVYHNEGVEFISNKFDLMIREDKMQPYPNVKTTQDCLSTYAAKAAMSTCADTFSLASSFSADLRLNKIENPYGISDLNPNGTLIPSSVLEYYKKYTGPGLGSYFSGATYNNANMELVKGVVNEVVAVNAGYNDYFTKMASIATKCNEADKIPTYNEPGLSTSKSGYAIIDVFRSGKKTCSFIVAIKDSQISFKVPKQYRKCVEESDAMITNIEQKDANGLLVSKKIAGSSDKFTAAGRAVPRVFASKENAESVKSILDGLDLGLIGANLSKSASVNIAEINFDKISSLNPTILKIVAVCEYGVDPSNYQEEFQNNFLPVWNNMEGDVVSADKGKNGGYYRAMYFHQLQNSINYPHLAKLHSQYKSGLISDDDLWNWAGKGLAICYMNYPTYWNPSYIFDYIQDGRLDDRSAIPSWTWDRDNILKD